MLVLASPFLVAGEWGGVLSLAVGLVFFAVARSGVTISEAGVVVQNPIRRRFVPWAEIVDIEYAALPQLRLRSGKTIGLEGVEPFPAAFPTRRSRVVFDEFLADLLSHLS